MCHDIDVTIGIIGIADDTPTIGKLNLDPIPVMDRHSKSYGLD